MLFTRPRSVARRTRRSPSSTRRAAGWPPRSVKRGAVPVRRGPLPVRPVREPHVARRDRVALVGREAGVVHPLHGRVRLEEARHPERAAAPCVHPHAERPEVAQGHERVERAERRPVVAHREQLDVQREVLAQLVGAGARDDPATATTAPAIASPEEAMLLLTEWTTMSARARKDAGAPASRPSRPR
jgi:hypothetical protein